MLSADRTGAAERWASGVADDYLLFKVDDIIIERTQETAGMYTIRGNVHYHKRHKAAAGICSVCRDNFLINQIPRRGQGTLNDQVI